MAQRYNIYINEQVLCIAEYVPGDLGDHQLIDNQKVDIRFLSKQVNDPVSTRKFLLLSSDPKKAYKKLTGWLKVIEAAGGLIRNEKGEYLAIFRRGKWDLPKGKIDAGEKKREAAVREVEEECGITVNITGDKIGKTYHIYRYKGDMVLKKSHWYHMEATSDQKLVPQLDEDITEVRWFSALQLDTVLENTFPSIRDVLEQGSAISR